jgi:hypothetical protein
MQDRLQALPANIRAGNQAWSENKSLAYVHGATVTTSLITLTQGQRRIHQLRRVQERHQQVERRRKDGFHRFQVIGRRHDFSLIERTENDKTLRSFAVKTRRFLVLCSTTCS